MSLGLSRLSGPAERHYDADDRGFMATIADRVAIAIDNAMLFEEERRTALAFQTSLLPQRLPSRLSSLVQRQRHQRLRSVPVCRGSTGKSAAFSTRSSRR